MRALSFLHDAELVCLKMDKKTNSILVCFENENGARQEIKAADLIFVRSVDMAHQNIVGYVLSSRFQDFDEKSILEWLRWITSSMDSGSFLDEKNIKKACERILRGDWELMLVFPSAGMQMGIVAKNIEVYGG